MNLYMISQGANNDYDTYDAAIVAAESEEKAVMMHPSGRAWDGKDGAWSSWTSWDKVEVELIGTTLLDSGVVLVSFNAG